MRCHIVGDHMAPQRVTTSVDSAAYLNVFFILTIIVRSYMLAIKLKKNIEAKRHVLALVLKPFWL
jgi:hypothetical protein